MDSQIKYQLFVIKIHWIKRSTAFTTFFKLQVSDED
jgi:hypothetical protein